MSTSVSPGGCEICLCCPQSKFTALICFSEHSVCKHSGIPVQGFALVCSFFVCGGWGGFIPNSSRRGQEQQYLSSSLLTIYQLYISLTVARSTSVHISPLSVTLPSVCCCPGSRARVWTHSRSYASAACSLFQCMSSCTGVGEGSTRKGHRLPCCKLSTWRQFPSEGW